MKSRRLRTNEVAKLFRVNRKRVDGWVRQGRIVPAVRPRGSGSSMKFGLIDVMALGAAFGLRRAGFTVGMASVVCAAVKRYSVCELERCFEDGRTHLMILPAKLTVYPGLLPAEAITSNPELTRLAAESGMMPVGLDLQRLYERLKEQIGQLDREPQEAPTT